VLARTPPQSTLVNAPSPKATPPLAVVILVGVADQGDQAGILGNLREQTYNDVLAGAARAGFVAELRDNRPGMRICGGCEVGPAGAAGPPQDAALDGGNN